MKFLSTIFVYYFRTEKKITIKALYQEVFFINSANFESFFFAETFYSNFIDEYIKKSV